MEILKENIKIISVADGSIFIGQINDPEYGVYNNNMLCTLNYPFRLIPTQTGVQVGATLTGKEEWVTISTSGAVQYQVTDKVFEIYNKYYEQVFGSGLVIPEEKRIII